MRSENKTGEDNIILAMLKYSVDWKAVFPSTSA